MITTNCFVLVSLVLSSLIHSAITLTTTRIYTFLKVRTNCQRH